MKKSIISILTISIIASIGLYAWYVYQKSTVIAQRQKQLLTIAQQRVKEINHYLATKEDYLRSLAQEEKVIKFLATGQHDQKFNSFIQSYQKAANFKNIVLIDADGNVIFANNDPEKFKINVTEHPYQQMSLSQSFDRSIKTMTPDVASFSFDKLLKKPTLYSTIPVFDSQTKFIGVVAVQLNVQEIYAITNNYFDLGKTGDVILAESIEHGAQIIAPTRNDPDSAFDIIEYQDGKAAMPIQHAIQGSEGSMVALNYRGQKVVAAWSYIPALAWGITVTIAYNEAAQPIKDAYNWWWGSLFILLAISLLLCLIEHRTILAWIKKHIAVHPVNVALSIGIAGTIVLTTYLAYHYTNLQYIYVAQAHQSAERKIQHVTDQISNELENIMLRAQAIADDLSEGRLHKTDIEIRVKRDIKENPLLYGLIVAFEPYQFDETRKLYAPHFVRHNDDYKHEQLDTLYDYTKEKTALGQPSTIWYQTALEKGASWLKPMKQQLTGTMVAQYVVPFYEKDDTQKPIGVIVAEFALDSLSWFTKKIMIGTTGYSFMISKGGTFIYHPNKTLVANQQTIFDYAQKQINKPLHTIGKTIIKGGQGHKSYIDPTTSAITWIHYAHIPHSPWSLALVFQEEEISIPAAMIRHALMSIITALLLGLLFLLLLLCRIFVARKKFMQMLALSRSIILLCGLGGLWFIISQTVGEAEQITNEVITNNQASLNAFIEEKRQEAASKYQKVITIPTGILIKSLDFDDANHITFNGYIWQHYTKGMPLARKIMVPGATKISLEKIHEEKSGSREVIGWKVTATIPEKFSYTQYPFDRKHVIIPLSHPDQNILLTPDFNGYESFYQAQFLGIPRDFSLSRFSIEDTFFSYRATEQQAAITNTPSDESIELHYTMLLNRNTLHAFIIYIIPLFVILFSLFAALAFTKVTDRITSAAIIPYTAPLFALIILHGNLRRTFITGDILYIEYLFFLTYVTIILAISFNILISRQERKTKTNLSFISILIKLFFWPTQFALWYGATIIAFY